MATRARSLLRYLAIGFLVTSIAGVSVASLIAGGPGSLTEARSGFVTSVHLVGGGPPPEPPPEEFFERVKYPAPLGESWAYVSPPSREGRRAGVVYVHGGFDWSIGALSWSCLPRENDQSGRGLWRDEIALMLPSFRGNHDNPGEPECLYGEVDDLIAAADYLATRPDVDPDQVYLVGHSTGATLALLAAQMTDRFRGVFAIGPVGSIEDYGEGGCLPRGLRMKESVLRAPMELLELTRSPTVIIEGNTQPSNSDLLPLFERYRGDAPIEVLGVPGLDHFSVLAPATEVIARAISRNRDSGRPFIDVQDIVDVAPQPCDVSRLEGTGTAEPATWVERPPAQWPQMVLTNEAQFSERTALSGASAFFLEAGDDVLLLATARHLTGYAGGVEPPLDDAALLLPARFARQLRSWTVFPRTQPERSSNAVGLAEPAILGDWLVLTLAAARPPEQVVALRLASLPVSRGDAVYLVGCPYEETDCVQNVYGGRVTWRMDHRFGYTLDPPVDVRGFSGAPILNEAGRVVGVFSVSEDLDTTDDGRHVEAEADDRLVQHASACRRP